jgi:hypothetical protein
MERKDERLMEERILKWQEYHGTKGNITYTQRQSSKMSRGQFIRFQNSPHPNLGRVIPEDQKTQFRKTEVLLLRHF